MDVLQSVSFYRLFAAILLNLLFFAAVSLALKQIGKTHP